MAAKRPLALAFTEAGNLPKADALALWRALPKGSTITFEASAADATGSSYEGDSLRLTGSLKSLKSVLANLQSLLRYDNASTRLDVAFSRQKHKHTRQFVPDKFVLYLKVVEKVRTTRARQATAAPRAAPTRASRTRARSPAPTAPVPAAQPALAELPAAAQEALEALRVLGQPPAEAQRRLERVVAEQGAGLDCAGYVTQALRVALPKKAPPK